MHADSEKKEIIMTEEELARLPELASALFDAYPETDPRSNRYVRHFNRPRIRWHLLLCFCLGLAAVVWLSVFISGKLSFPVYGTVLLIIALLILYAFLLRRFLLLGIIRIYQHFAPESIRNKCVYEPSCSEYMIQAIQRYGAISGLVCGIKRLRRCNAQNGGFDPV